MITSGYVSICKKDQEIEKLKYDIDILTRANDTLLERTEALYKDIQRLESILNAEGIDIDDGK
jgi:uncharacterized protein YoxC